MGNSLQTPTSIKQIMQQMTPQALDVVQGTVIATAPLQIQLLNDSKMLVSGNILCIPRHLTNYTTTVSISLDSGTIDSITIEGQGTHGHGPSGQHSGHSSGSGEHTHPDSEGKHLHKLETFNIANATMTVHNALGVGEQVYILSFDHGKKYYILDRVVG